jgi:hypothetical protein
MGVDLACWYGLLLLLLSHCAVEGVALQSRQPDPSRSYHASYLDAVLNRHIQSLRGLSISADNSSRTAGSGDRLAF